jgi:hypothetical protein
MQGSSSELKASVPANLSKDGNVETGEVSVTGVKPEIISTIEPSSEEERIRISKPHDPESHRQKVTIWLVGILAGLILVNFSFMFFLDWNGKKLENVSNAYNATLPVIAGLAGSAVTYYFTRRSDK